MSESNDDAGGVVAVETSNDAPIEVESRLLSDGPQEREQYQQTWMDYYRRWVLGRDGVVGVFASCVARLVYPLLT